MKHEQAYKIAMEAASLSVNMSDDLSAEEYFREYYDQLVSNDYQCLTYWLGYMITEGKRAAVKILKMILMARLEERRKANCIQKR